MVLRLHYLKIPRANLRIVRFEPHKRMNANSQPVRIRTNYKREVDVRKALPAYKAPSEISALKVSSLEAS